MSQFLKNIFIALSLMYHSSWGFIHSYAIPAIKFIEGIKYFLTLNKKDGKAHDFIDFLKTNFSLSEAVIETLLKSFVANVKFLLPDLEISCDSDDEVLIAQAVFLSLCTYLSTLSAWHKDLLYLKLGSLLLIDLAAESGHELKDNDALSLVQISYSNHKLNNNL